MFSADYSFCVEQTKSHRNQGSAIQTLPFSPTLSGRFLPWFCTRIDHDQNSCSQGHTAPPPWQKAHADVATGTQQGHQSTTHQRIQLAPRNLRHGDSHQATPTGAKPQIRVHARSRCQDQPVLEPKRKQQLEGRDGRRRSAASPANLCRTALLSHKVRSATTQIQEAKVAGQRGYNTPTIIRDHNNNHQVSDDESHFCLTTISRRPFSVSSSLGGL